MTRTDLLNKKVDKLNNTSEALELISLLNYGECIAVLMNTKNIPSEIHAALMKRAKEANGGTTLQIRRRRQRNTNAAVSISPLFKNLE